MARNLATGRYYDKHVAAGVSYFYRVVAIGHSGRRSSPSRAVRVVAGTGGGPAPYLFSPDSPFNQILPADAAIDKSSAQRVAGIAGRAAQYPTRVSITSYSTPIYVVGADTPLVPVHVVGPLTPASGNDKLEDVLSRGVPIPPHALSAAGSDGHLTVYQPSTYRLWDLWRACSPEGTNSAPGQAPQKCPSPPPATWTTQHGGVILDTRQSLGYYDKSTYPGYSTWIWGSTATSLPVVAGTATIAELKSGHIDHALALDLPAFGPGGVCQFWTGHGYGPTPVVWPAQRADGGSTSPDCVPEGARLRIDPGYDLSNAGLPHFALMFAVAAQRYGMIVRDKAGGAPSFFAEDPVSLRIAGAPTDPYTGNAWGSTAQPTQDSLLGGVPQFKQLNNFPWNHVQLMRMSVCHKGGPCPRRGN